MLWEMEGLEEIVGLEMTTKSVGAGTNSNIWRDRLPDFRILGWVTVRGHKVSPITTNIKGPCAEFTLFRLTISLSLCI